jgi:hypothetical protein
MDASRTATSESRALARIEGQLDRLLDLLEGIRFDLVDLQAELRLRDIMTARVVELQRRTLGRLRRLERSIYGDNGPA